MKDEHLLVGLAYDLRREYLDAGFSELETAEFDRPDTIDAIEQALTNRGHQVVRIGNIRSLVQRLAAGDRWDIVFNIAEGMYGAARESQVPALLEAYQIPCVFSDSLVLAVSLDKSLAKHLLRARGVPTPEFAVVADSSGLDACAHLRYPLFVKPLSEGTGRGIDGLSKVCDAAALQGACRRVWDSCGQPALVEEFLPGREFTVGLVGTGAAAVALGVVEVVIRGNAEHGEVYSYENKENCEDLVDYVKVCDSDARVAVAVALDAWRGLGCRDGGRVDVRLDAHGVANFIEVNPLAGLHPEHSDLPIIARLHGVSYQELIDRIMHSASRTSKKQMLLRL